MLHIAKIITIHLSIMQQTLFSSGESQIIQLNPFYNNLTIQSWRPGRVTIVLLSYENGPQIAFQNYPH